MSHEEILITGGMVTLNNVHSTVPRQSLPGKVLQRLLVLVQWAQLHSLASQDVLGQTDQHPQLHLPLQTMHNTLHIET